MNNFCRFDLFMAHKKVNSHVVRTWLSTVRRNNCQSKMICETNDVPHELQNDIIVFIVLSVQLSARHR